MKKLLCVFTISVCVLTCVAQAAVNVKKAAPVSAKKANVAESATSLLPTVIGLVSNVKSLQAQQEKLSADCAPTSDELNTVNELIKEWAKLGEVTAEGVASGIGKINATGGYRNCVESADNPKDCYETFTSSADKGTVWENFPKASSAKKCKDGNKDCATVSNMYDIFVKIPFGSEDYTRAEAKKIAVLTEKAQRCAPSKLAAAKRELYGGFLTQTLSGVGQSTGAAGTTSVLDAVSSMGGGADIKSMLPSLGQMAVQTLDK